MRLRLCSRGDVLDGEEDKVSATLAKELARIEQHGPLTKGLVTGYDAMIGSPGVPVRLRGSKSRSTSKT